MGFRNLFFLFSLFFLLSISVSVFSLCGSDCATPGTVAPSSSDPNVVKQDFDLCGVGGRSGGAYWQYYSNYDGYLLAAPSKCCIWTCKKGYEKTASCPGGCQLKAGCQTQAQVCTNKNGVWVSNCGTEYTCTCDPGYIPDSSGRNCVNTVPCDGQKPTTPGIVFGPDRLVLTFENLLDTGWHGVSTEGKLEPCAWRCGEGYSLYSLDPLESIVSHVLFDPKDCCENSKTKYGLTGSVFAQNGKNSIAICCPSETNIVTHTFLGRPKNCCDTSNGEQSIVFGRDKASSSCCSTNEEATFGADGEAISCCNKDNIVYGKPNSVFDKGGVKEIKACCYIQNSDASVVAYNLYGTPECCALSQTKKFGLGAFAEGGTRESSLCCNLDTSTIIYNGVGLAACESKKSCSVESPCKSVCEGRKGDFTQYKCENSKCVFDTVYRLKKYFGETCSKDDTKVECKDCGTKCVNATQYQAYSCGVEGKCIPGAISSCTGEKNICIEHKELDKPITIECTAPQDVKSLYFETGATEFHNLLSDKTKIQYGKTQFITQNTFYGLNTPEEVFSRAREIVALLPPTKKIDLILSNHGFNGKIYFGDKELVFDLDYFNKFNWTPYDSLKGRINNIVFESCRTGAGDPITGKPIGEIFATAWANQFNAKVVASIPDMATGVRKVYPKPSLGENPQAFGIRVGPNRAPEYLHTVFYLADFESYFSGASSVAYQTKVLSGDLNVVTVYVDDNVGGNLLVDMDDELQLCPSTVVRDVNVVLDSSHLVTNTNGFHIIADLNSLNSPSVLVNVKVLSVDCSSVYPKDLYQPAFVDLNTLVAARSLMGKGLVDASDYFKLKELSEKGAECLLDSDCVGAACPLGLLDCYNACVSGVCVPKESERVCDGLDDNNNGLIDEGCDKDGDRFVDQNKTCVGSFYSSGDVYSVDVNIPNTVLSLKSGWNMVSVPVYNLHSSDLYNYKYGGKDCNALVWGYLPSGAYTTVQGFLVPGKGYFIYSVNDCEFDFNVAPYSVPEKFDLVLNPNGFTMVSGFKGDLGVGLGEYGPFFSLVNGKYVAVNRAYSTQAFWVRRNDQGKFSCTRKDSDDTNPQIQ